jgi:hypothetical protein
MSFIPGAGSTAMKTIERGLIALFVLGAATAFSGCATVHLNCPTVGPPMVVTLNNPDGMAMVSQLVTLIGTMPAFAAPPKPAARLAATPAATPGDTLDWKTVAFFGTQSVSCGPQAPSTGN